MNAPDNDPFAFDERLRAHYEEASQTPPPPPARVWKQLQSQLPTRPSPVAPSRRAPLLAGAGGLVLGILLTWGLTPSGGTTPAAIVATVATKQATDQSAPPAVSFGQESSGTAAILASPARDSGPGASRSGQGSSITLPSRLNREVSLPIPVRPKPAETSVGGGHLLAAAVDSVTSRTGLSTTRSNGTGTQAVGEAIPVSLLPLIQTEATLAGLGPDTARATRERRVATLLTQRTTLAALTRRTDSLLLGLGVGPAASTTLSLTTDSLTPSPSAPLLPFRRWSAVLSFAPERNFFGLSAPAADTLSSLRRTHEQGRAGYNAALLAEYRLDSRLSVGAGLGVASYGAELRLTDHRTAVSTRLDSATTTSTIAHTVVTYAYIVKQVRDSVLVPILDFNNVVTGYQYLPTTRPDTIRTNLTNTEVVNHSTTTYTPTVTTRQEVSARILKPNYRFLTVPLLVRYRLGRATDWTSSPTAPRWWADVAVGTQLQWFLGGMQVTTRDGLLYQTERVGPRGGPFRPFSLALTGAVAFNYALTPRLSASLAPTLRWQVESVYKASTNLTQRPAATGVQFGIRYAF